jgi:hypothetical protein
LFCTLSFSGSVYLSFAFVLAWWLVLRVVSIRFALSYGILIALAGYMYLLVTVGYEPLKAGTTYLAQYGDFLAKTASIKDRGLGAIASMDAALLAPFGSSTLSDMAGPWLLNAALAAGWLGVFVLLLFLRRLASAVEVLVTGSRTYGSEYLGGLVLLGVTTTVIVFNDYQMSNYAGLVLMAFVYRTILVKNEIMLATHAAAGVSVQERGS